MRRALWVGIVLLVLHALPLAAQDALVGTWNINYPAGARVEEGVQTPVMGTGVLRIEAQGDSLVGELVADPVPDIPARAPGRMTGPRAAGPVPLVTRAMLLVEVNGEQRAVTLTSTWLLEARGDSLVGTLSHKVEGADVSAQDPGPVRGVRQQ